MSTEVAKIENTATAIENAAREEGAGELGALLKFSKGHYFVGTDEIPIGREYIAHVQHWVRGWVKFKDGALVESRVGRVADGYIVPPRDQLDELDETKWENDPAGNPKDPWCHQSYLPLEDIESGEIVTFVSGSSGGRGAISKLCGRAAKHLATMGSPRIKLGVELYRHRSFGRIEKPSFAITGWTNDAPQPAATDFSSPSSNDFADDIPF